MEAFVFAHVKRGDLAGGIVNGAVDGIFLPVPFEPGKRTRIDLQQKPCLRTPFPPSVGLKPPAFLGRFDVRISESGMQGCVADINAVMFGKTLSEVAEISRAINIGFLQGDNFILRFLRNGIMRRPQGIFMNDSSRARFPHFLFQALHLPLRQP
ncbi:hypothetical protein SDC9_135379 [bioreactor metagenome]|uniref:Uncharacterized protein n=1 Tax=bioreactor metagenome TaxID=1076179 RepID=A0A645DG80_9ZZZZ